MQLSEELPYEGGPAAQTFLGVHLPRTSNLSDGQPSTSAQSPTAQLPTAQVSTAQRPTAQLSIAQLLTAQQRHAIIELRVGTSLEPFKRGNISEAVLASACDLLVQEKRLRSTAFYNLKIELQDPPPGMKRSRRQLHVLEGDSRTDIYRQFREIATEAAARRLNLDEDGRELVLVFVVSDETPRLD